MDSEAFRREGHALVEWIAAYLDGSERYPVLSRAAPGEVRDAIPATPPTGGASFDEIFRDFERVIVPGLTHWNHPGFFAYFAISGSAPGVLAEFLSAALNVQAMLWRTSPAATELEEVTLGWLRQLLGLPDAFEGVIYDTASVSTLHALAAARQRVAPDTRTRGMAGRGDLPALAVYASEQSHSSVDKAVMTLGLGLDAIRKIPVDDRFRMRVDALRAAIAADRSAGVAPMAVVATLGTTSTTSVDPVQEIATVLAGDPIWLHVDAAYAGAAALAPGMRDVMAGCALADSLVMNPHKWLFTPFDLSAFYCRRMDEVRAAFSLTPDYLRTPEADAGVRNLMDTGVQLGRRFRALKLWAVLRYFGSEGIGERLAEHLRLAQLFAGWVDESGLFERLAPVPFSVVCFRARPEGNASDEDLDLLNERLLDAVNATGDVFLSHTKINGAYALRLAIGHIRTEERHVRRAWDVLNEQLALLQ